MADKKTQVSVYQQTCHGRVQYRVMRDDGQLIFDRHQTDFDNEDEALAAIRGEFRRKRLGAVRVRIREMAPSTGICFPGGRERFVEFADSGQ